VFPQAPGTGTAPNTSLRPLAMSKWVAFDAAEDGGSASCIVYAGAYGLQYSAV